MHKRVVALTLGILVACATGAAAQATTGTITGRVIDPQGLVTPGATVTVSGDQGSKIAITDSEGRFTVPFLTPGTYAVRAELQGFKPHELLDVAVRLGQTTDVALTLTVETVTDTVVVTGTAPVIDPTTTTTGVNLDIETLNQIPIGRRFSDTLFIAPGVSSGGGTGDANPSISGASGLENQYVVDGVNLTNTGFGALGSYSIVFGSLGNGLPFEFMQEVQVKTAGYEPEFGASTGGIANVITKSGSNTLRGTAFGYIRDGGLQADFTQITTRNGTVNTTGSQLWDTGVEVGGPVIADSVFFFGAVDSVFERRTLIAPEDFPLRSMGDVDRERKILNYAAKGTWQLSSVHRVDASFFGDPANGEAGPQRSDALLRQDAAAFSELTEYGGHNQTVRYHGVFKPNWLLEASFAYAQNDLVEAPSVDEWSVRDATVTPNILSGGIGFYEPLNDGRNIQYQVKSTNLFNAGGNHSLRYGVVFEDVSYESTIQRTGPTIVLPNGERSVTGAQVTILPDPVFGRIFRVERTDISNIADSEQDYLSLFAQDTWEIGNRLTIRGGLRWDRQKLIGNLADFTWNDNFAPRIGGTFDPTGTGRSKIFANWGRYYARIPNDLAIRALSSQASVTRADYFDAELTRPIADGVLAGGQTRHFIQTSPEAAAFDPDANSTSHDEFVVGAEYELLPKLNLSVRYINRRVNDILEDIGNAPIAAFLTLPASELGAVEFLITNPGPGSQVGFPEFGAAHEAPIFEYDAIEVQADKRFGDNWGLQASYRWGRLEGTFEGFFRNDNGQSDPAITSLFDFPTNDPSFAQLGLRGDIRYLGALGQGPLPNDQRHQAKVFGNYLWDFGLNLGVGFVASSGRPLTPLAAHPIYSSGGEIPEETRGSGIETVDGFRTRTETQYNLDFHADYGFRLPTGQRIVAIADLFNLFNLDQVLRYDERTELSFGVPNPDFGAVRSTPLQPGIQEPFQARLGVRFEF